MAFSGILATQPFPWHFSQGTKFPECGKELVNMYLLSLVRLATNWSGRYNNAPTFKQRAKRPDQCDRPLLAIHYLPLAFSGQPAYQKRTMSETTRRGKLFIMGYYFMHQWLQNYDYRAPLSWWIFAVAAIGAMTITLLTVSFQAIRAALINPVKSLRTE
jgi:hypothetical protein